MGSWLRVDPDDEDAVAALLLHTAPAKAVLDDPAGLHAVIAGALGTDDVDVPRASALLRFEAARHGRCVHEGAAGAHEAFVLDAMLFWCDAEAVIRRAHAAVPARGRARRPRGGRTRRRTARPARPAFGGRTDRGRARP